MLCQTKPTNFIFIQNFLYHTNPADTFTRIEPTLTYIGLKFYFKTP